MGNKLSTIGNIVSLARSVTLILLFKTLFKFFCAFDLYCIIYDWISIMGYSKRGLSAIKTASGNVCACVKLAGTHLLTGNRNGRKPF